ncbi:MAG: 4-(cytidine 5'-diphospho)-2-C-methyl-D-erythritol kinase [Eubacteriales bacterium]|nr:4-(cytidine 5'-diphospho)-2-C-methyl-D-erythritol kinase [Eubacteriales bacterium]
MRLRAMAKINLGLDVQRKREDGYHDVRMIMQTIQMYDVLEMEKSSVPGIVLTTNFPYLPTDSKNLVWKAAELLMQEFGITEGLTIDLQKFIPVAAGMAGGSADAAAAMVGVNRLFDLKLSEKELMDRAVRIGADVPYCVMRGTALAEGIGELLTPLAPLPLCWILIGKPDVSVSTKTAYENLRLGEIKTHPLIDEQISALDRGDLYALTKRMENVFEPGIEKQYPIVREIREFMEAHGAVKAMMSGSGPTVFGIFDTEAKGQAAAEALRESHLAKVVFLTVPYNRREKGLMSL